MTERMKAAMVDAFGNPLEIEEVPIPTPGSRKIQRSSMKTLRKQTLRIYAGLTIVIMGTAPCGAIDYQPFDFVPQVPNTLLLMNYYEFETRNELNNTITGTNKNHTGLTSQIGILRPIYYNQVFDHPYMLEFLLPYGVEYNYKAERLRFWNLTAVTITEHHPAPAGTDNWGPNQVRERPRQVGGLG